MSTWKPNKRISYVNLSIYPSPCNCDCFYCNLQDGNRIYTYEKVEEKAYENIFKALEYVRKTKLVADLASWQVACGEITVHPFRERIYRLTGDRACEYLTNCFLYDAELGKILSLNPFSCINLSIDAGTDESWKLVKGTDNFPAVVENLVRYRKASVHPKQITMKYLVFPNINDSPEDFNGIVTLMKRLQVQKLRIVRDVKAQKFHTESDKNEVVSAARRLAETLTSNGLTFDVRLFSPEETEIVNSALNWQRCTNSKV